MTKTRFMTKIYHSAAILIILSAWTCMLGIIILAALNGGTITLDFNHYQELYFEIGLLLFAGPEIVLLLNNLAEAYFMKGYNKAKQKKGMPGRPKKVISNNFYDLYPK